MARFCLRFYPVFHYSSFVNGLKSILNTMKKINRILKFQKQSLLLISKELTFNVQMMKLDDDSARVIRTTSREARSGTFIIRIAFVWKWILTFHIFIALRIWFRWPAPSIIKGKAPIPTITVMTARLLSTPCPPPKLFWFIFSFYQRFATNKYCKN